MTTTRDIVFINGVKYIRKTPLWIKGYRPAVRYIKWKESK